MRIVPVRTSKLKMSSPIYRQTIVTGLADASTVGGFCANTEKMMQAWGGEETWTPKAVYIGLPDGRWTMATMHNVAHGSQTISGNNYDGQNCVHFLRNMSECESNDPDYGVTNQNALRKAWKSKTGIPSSS